MTSHENKGYDRHDPYIIKENLPENLDQTTESKLWDIYYDCHDRYILLGIISMLPQRYDSSTFFRRSQRDRWPLCEFVIYP